MGRGSGTPGAAGLGATCKPSACLACGFKGARCLHVMQVFVVSTDEAGDFPLFHNQLINREAAERRLNCAG